MSGAIFDSFNARNLSPEQVAKTFIPPKHFATLAQRQHSLVVGPRGSGKTTLLKMLQPRALSAWQHPHAQQCRERIDFVGVFIASDISWGAQLEALNRNRLIKAARDQLGVAAFTTHVLIALSQAMADVSDSSGDKLPNLTADVSRQIETVIVAELARAWSLDIEIPSFFGLVLGLRHRLKDIYTFASVNADEEEVVIQARLQSFKDLHIDFMMAVSLGIEIFNGFAKTNLLWALLFDELEIAPRAIRRVLFRALRSADQRIIFKLSISPFGSDLDILEKAVGAMRGHDYEPIYLWYKNKEDGYPFSRELFKSILLDMGNAPVEPETLFENSISSQENYEPYEVGGYRQKAIARLADVDQSFHSYLFEHGIDIGRLDSLPNEVRAQVLRKAAWPIQLRAESLRRGHGGKLQKRSRKNPALYAGAEAIFGITEGNPRWLIGLMRRMLAESGANNATISAAKQDDEVERLCGGFRALLKTYPYDSPIPHEKKRGLLSLLDDLGAAFALSVYGQDFVPEPPGTFIVDSTTNPRLLAAIGQALNAGALVHVDEGGGGALLSSLKGKRFRLSYLLAQHYQLPLVLGRPVSLSSLLRLKVSPQEFQFSFEDLTT